MQVSNPVVQILRVRREGGSSLIAYYIGALRRDPEAGRSQVPRAARPFAPEVPTSQWRAQLGLRVRTGR
ncbi:MAG: hypothetical protein OXU64_08380 [Gemmatimonadota bacterium]|nr:hypothetical protein [Gemmatimonadota bacterium]